MRHILVPLDGTAEAESALPLARLIARRADAAVVLAHVVVPHAPTESLAAGSIGGAVPLLPPTPTVAHELRRARQDYLDHVVARTRAALRPAAPDRRAHESGAPDAAAAGDAPGVHGVLLDGAPSTALHQSALDVGADLVIMASHGRRGIARLLLGSTTEDVVRAGGLPVLAVPRAEALDGTGVAGTSLGPQLDAPEAALPRHLLVALDGSREAEAILGPAVALARLLGSRVTVATVRDGGRAHRATLLPTSVLDTEPSDGRAGVPVPAVPSDAAARERAAAPAADDVAALLERVAARLAAEGCAVEVRVLDGHPVADRLLACREELGVDWFALTTHAHGWWKRLVEGSVAEALLQRADAPVLLLHPTDVP